MWSWSSQKLVLLPWCIKIVRYTINTPGLLRQFSLESFQRIFANYFSFILVVTLLNDRLLLLFLLFPTKTSDCLYVSTYRTFQSRVIFVPCDKSHERWACRGDVLLHKALLTMHSCGKENELTTGNVLNSLSCSWTNACKWRNKQTHDSCSYVSTERKFSKIFRCGMSQQFERRLVVR